MQQERDGVVRWSAWLGDMNEQAKLALINWTGLVSTAIARQANGKDVDWREIVDAQETLSTALQSGMPDPYATQSPNDES